MRYLAKAALSAALATWLAPALAATTLTATPATAHPGLAITATGAGFGDGEAVDVYFDTVDSALGVTSATGALSVLLTIPASTQPGTHYITAIGRKSGDAVQKIFVVATAWIESGFGAGHLAWNPYENTLSTSVVSSLELQWAAPCAYCWGSPAVVNGYAFVGAAGGGGGFFGLSAATGAIKWSADLGSYFYGAPAFANNVVYAEDASGVVHAYTAGTGKEQWTKSIGEYSTQALIFSGGVLYAPGYEGVFTFSASGTPGWSFSASGQVSGVAVGAGLVFFTSGDGVLHALNATTGVTAWTYTLASGIAGQPAVANGIVYVGDYQGNFYALRAKNGALLWQAGKAPDTIWGAPAVANGIVYVEDASGDFYAYQAASGELLWDTSLNGYSGIGAGPAVADGVVYVSAGVVTTALDAQYGQALVGLGVGYESEGVPVIANGMLYITSTDGDLYAYAPNGAGADATRRAVTAPALSSLHPDLSLVPQH